MFVCSCNALTDQDVLEACRTSAGTPSRVYRCLGCKPQCGICLRTIKTIFETVQIETMTAEQVEASLFDADRAERCACDGNCCACTRNSQGTKERQDGNRAAMAETI